MSVVIETSLGSAETGFTAISAVERYEGDREYVAGAIELSVDGAPVITRDEWDDVNWLWPFVVEASAGCRESGSGEIYFPDQPILFRAERLPGSDRVKLSLTAADLQRAAVADAEEYYRAIAAAGLEFLQHLDRLVSAAAQPLAAQLGALRAWLP